MYCKRYYMSSSINIRVELKNQYRMDLRTYNYNVNNKHCSHVSLCSEICSCTTRSFETCNYFYKIITKKETLFPSITAWKYFYLANSWNAYYKVCNFRQQLHLIQFYCCILLTRTELFKYSIEFWTRNMFWIILRC